MAEERGCRRAEEWRESGVGFEDGGMVGAADCAADVVVEGAKRSLLHGGGEMGGLEGYGPGSKLFCSHLLSVKTSEGRS